MIDSQEKAEAEEKKAPAGTVVHEAILQEGETELQRKSSSLAWSGLAAGLSMGFTFLAEGILRHHLPDTDWRILVTKLGYSFGFLIVVLGRQQLFTENTLTVILPFLSKKSSAILVNIARLWLVVYVANIIGAFLFALMVARTGAVNAALHDTLIQVGHDAIRHDAMTMFVRAIFAGWLIALMVWLLPFAESFRVVVIILITYLVGVAEFPHIIAGAVTVLHLVASGEVSFLEFVTRFMTPTLLGNIVGGVFLVALLGHAQHKEEKQG
jgi:formate/nitrite transporter FocA (FNT family)